MQIEIKNEDELAVFAEKLWNSIAAPQIVYLIGDLGAGKTTLVRQLLFKAGYRGKVKSPTYGLVEEYSLTDCTVFHFDLYRLTDPDELEWIGIRDYMTTNSIWLVEWPQLGQGVLPKADLVVQISGLEERYLKLRAETPAGEKSVKNLQEELLD